MLGWEDARMWGCEDGLEVFWLLRWIYNQAIIRVRRTCAITSNDYCLTFSWFPGSLEESLFHSKNITSTCLKSRREREKTFRPNVYWHLSIHRMNCVCIPQEVPVGWVPTSICIKIASPVVRPPTLPVTYSWESPCTYRISRTGV